MAVRNLPNNVDMKTVLNTMGAALDKTKPNTQAQPPKSPAPAAKNATIAAPTTLTQSFDLLQALTGRLREGKGKDEPKVVTVAVTPLRYQAATVIAKTLAGSRISGHVADMKLSGGTPEQLVNLAVRIFLRYAHTIEAWHDAGRMLQLAQQMDIHWDESILSPEHRKAMDYGV